MDDLKPYFCHVSSKLGLIKMLLMDAKISEGNRRERGNV
jgi:hypothetical protein